jgi:hypothetical protein
MGVDSSANAQGKGQGKLFVELASHLGQGADRLQNLHHPGLIDPIFTVNPHGHDRVTDIFIHPATVLANDFSGPAKPGANGFGVNLLVGLTRHDRKVANVDHHDRDQLPHVQHDGGGRILARSTADGRICRQTGIDRREKLQLSLTKGKQITIG